MSDSKYKRVRISKLSPVDDPKFTTPSSDDYNSLRGEVDMTLPIDYWVEGYLVREPQIGESVIVNRDVRNGIKVSGIFMTSAVVEISVNLSKFEPTETIFKTQNSIYRMELLS